MKKLSDYIIISDVDGTLLPKDSAIPQRNIDALNYFTEKGGKFGIATGRSKELTAEFVKTLPVNSPCIVYNGGGLYNFETDEFLMQNFLPDTARNDLDTIRNALPGISVLVITGNDYYHINHEIPFASFSEEHRKKFKDAKIENLTLPWYKVLFSVNPEESKRFDDYMRTTNFPGIRFVHTNASLIEMLPESSTKGYAIQKLVDLGHFPRDSIVAIGDYYNDLEMIEFAAIGAVTAEAPDDLKAIADVVVGPCEGGAVADLIEYLREITE